MLFTQQGAKTGQQGIMAGLRQVIDVDLVCQSFAASSTHRNERGVGMVHRPRRHRHLGPYLVACVNDGIDRLRQHRRPVVTVDKFLDARDDTSGVDAGNTFTHGLHLGLSYGVVHGMHLAIDIGFGDVVQIDQCQATHATACQRLCTPRADTTDADNGHMRCAYARSRCDPEQSLHATEAAREICARVIWQFDAHVDTHICRPVKDVINDAAMG